MNQQKSTSTSWALILIAVAIAGAGISYHFTLESRFASIEQKLDQNSLALQEYQASQETIFSSKTETLNNLNKEVDALQSSLEPLGKSTREQTESLSEIRKQVASLQQSQQAQQDAQKKLSDYAGQLEKIKHDIQVQSTPTPPPSVPISTPAASPLPLIAPHASSADVPLALPPHADSVVDLRPALITVANDASVRALPVAMPVSLSAADDIR
jgi:Skp family chaperone for outer membrane proteins